ncbi:MAG: relaxase/mobilization nuclease domain-containing protein, partial [Bacteroidetes bacterium]|nr:relaxase/mobilization nuclease domain-containing protein [Bacteroidota bacterium]
MIAKIGKGEHLYGAISYNQQKIDKEKGQVLLLNKIPETLNNTYSTHYLNQQFEPYLAANFRTEKPVRHISLNPDPADKVSDGQFIKMAQQYMQEMGYGSQPYVVFKHTDIERTHIHIVTVAVGLDGKKIPDSYDHPRSMAICRKLEQLYNLVPATEKQRTGSEQIFRPVDYRAGDVKSQMASVVRHLPKYYGYASLGAYNALLSLFNITTEEVKGELNGQPKNGLVYFALNEQGEKASNPFKASRFGKHAGLEALQEHFVQSKEQMKNNPVRAVLKNTIEAAMHTAKGETDFKKQLLEQGINTVVRRNDEGRIYGMTFIDHESRTVWNGSALDKNLSANVFNDWWKEQVMEQRQNTEQKSTATLPVIDKNVTDEKEETHRLFDFLDKEQPT